MGLRSLLLCALVSYVIAASSIEDSLLENETVEVENVEFTTQDSSLTDLEDISIEGEVVNQDSEEHPESAAGFTNPIGQFVQGAARVKDTLSKGWNTITGGRFGASHKPKHRPEAKPDRRRGRTPERRPGHGPGRRPTHRPGRYSVPRPGRRPVPGSGRRPVPRPGHRTDVSHHHGKLETKPRRNSREGKPSRDSIHQHQSVGDVKPSPSGDDSKPQENTNKSGVGKTLLIAAAGTLTQTLAEGAGNSIVKRTNKFIDNVGVTPKERDDQYYNRPEDDYYGDDDSNEDASDYEDNGETCKNMAVKHCFEKGKNLDLFTKCVDEYECSRD